MVSRATWATALGLVLAAYCSAEEVEYTALQEPNLAAEDVVADVDGDYVQGSLAHWFGGTEISFLHVNARTGGRINMSFVNNVDGVSARFLGGDGLNSNAFAPRVWLGRKFTTHFGIVGRFWSLSDYEAGLPPIEPGTTPTGTNFGTFTASDRTRLATYDLEALATFTPGVWTFDSTIGARNVAFNTFSEMTAFGVFTTGNFVNLALSNGSDFQGTGVTGSLMARRQIGDSPFQFFMGWRGSALRGETDSFGRVSGTVASSPSAPLVGAATVTRANSPATASIHELQLGGQLNFQLAALPVNAFVRVAGEYQYWNIVGKPTGGAGFGGTIGDLTTNSFSKAGLLDASLFGASISAGFIW